MSVYTAFKRALLAAFRAPSEPPDAPAGTHASVRVLRASPRYLTYRLVPLGCGGAAIAAAFCGVTIGAIAAGEAAPLIASALIVVVGVPALALGYVCTRLDYELRYYVITDRSLRVREGAWKVEEKTISFSNVQNVRVARGPLQMLFKISDVHVDTAGGGATAQKHGLAMAGHGAVIAGVEEAETIRDQILEHLRRRAGDAGLGDPDDERAARRAAATPERVAALRSVEAAARALREQTERHARRA